MTDRAAYHARMAALVGSRNPVDTLELTPDRLRALAADHPDASWRERPFPSKWTPREVLAHLVDHEVVMAYRLRRIVLEQATRVEGYPQERWITARSRDGRNVSGLLDHFENFRIDTLSLWRDTPDQRLQDSVTRSDGTVETIRLQLTMHAGHDLAHLDQLRRYFSAIRGDTS